ncbi:heavy metal translocating P-type ATPase [Kurthia massiliensis]|uniref:heavy metal translocating P-type ATPase n=1 Tax=Kurthia massiliensis TaxID=1033739 RepID=UPI00028945BA|nr:heavy metal translocating P-type ATPase [Kurthia massiliensis]
MQQTNENNNHLIEKIKPHVELIAAIVAGLLIVFAWYTTRDGMNTVGITTFIAAFIIGGFAKAKEGVEETIANKELNVEFLMILAAIGSAIIGYWTEGAILIFIFALSGALETYAMNKSHKEISALMDMQPEEAWLVQQDGSLTRVKVDTLQIGDIVMIKPGERVPTDGHIIEGATSIDEAAITGESIPVSKFVGDEIFASTVNMTGAIQMEMTKPSSESLFQKIIDLVQSAQSEKSPSQQFIERFEGTYVKVVLLAVALMMFVPHFLLDWSWNTTFYRAMVLLVVASPCALVASIMPATLSAISNGARNGVLFKGGLHIEHLSVLRAVAFDKTGTLTQGKPIVTDFIVRPDEDAKHVLSMLAGIEHNSNHPLAVAITTYAKSQHVSFAKAAIQDIPGYGLEATIDNMHYKVGKMDFVGRERALAFADGAATTLAEQGKTVIFMADHNGIIAMAAMKDTVREEAKKAIADLKALGIHTVMLTGDNEKTAKAIAQEAGVESYIAECLPETKVQHMKDLMKQYQFVGMVGDGINDAPALATATTGIAMGEGTDVALETADVVLMKNDLSKIAYAIKLARKMQRIIKQNIVFAISVIIVLICSNFLQALDLPLGVVGHEGSTILVILNGLRLLRL